MRNTTNLRLIVSKSCVDLYGRCMQEDPLLLLLDSPRLRHLFEDMSGVPPYADFSAYWNATSKSKASTHETLEDALARAIKNYFFAQFTKAFVSSPRIWNAVKMEVEQRIKVNIDSIKLSFLDIYSHELAEIVLARRTLPQTDV